MDQVCGIYKITNLVNNKCYIGQSINISSRWKQHTQSLDKIENPDGENPLRRAFLKYGLTQQVSQPGVYGNFKFEVLLECDRDDLTKNEYAKIEELQPEYNRMMCPPSADRMWPRKQNLEKCCYVQYHNFNALGYLPFETYDGDWMNNPSYTSSKKRDCLKLKGEKVYLIVGLKQKGRKKKDFYLWEYTQVEEISFYGDVEPPEYGVSGTHFVCKKPLRLNDLPGFEHFAKHTMGSFAYGLQNAINDPFCEYIMDESNFALSKDLHMSSLEYLANFEDGIDDDGMKLTKRGPDDQPQWNLFTEGDEFPNAISRVRADGILVYHTDLFIERFREYQKEHKYIKTLFTPIFWNSVELVKKLPDIRHRIGCFYGGPEWEKIEEELEKFENVVLVGE